LLPYNADVRHGSEIAGQQAPVGDIERGRRLKRARENAKLKMAEIAGIIDKDPSFVSHVEAGRKRLSIDDVAALSAALNIPADYFVGLPGDDGFLGRAVGTPAIMGGGAMSMSEGANPSDDREITPEQAVENYQLILDEPNLHLKLKGGTLSIKDQADIADYIRFVHSKEQNEASDQSGTIDEPTQTDSVGRSTQATTSRADRR